MRCLGVEVMRTGQVRLSSEMRLSSMQRKRVEDIETFNAGSIRLFRAVSDLAQQNGVGLNVEKSMVSEMLCW